MEEYEEDAEEEVSLEAGKSSSRFRVLGFWVLVLGSWFIVPGAAAQTPQARRMLSCDGPLAPTMTPETLAAAFGEANVTTEDIDIGEGQFERGIVLFPKSAADRAEVLWRDGTFQRARAVFIRGERTRWKTAEGLTLGVSLQMIERLNRRPFRLVGFGWDYGGTTMSWSGGLLEMSKSTGCAIRARLSIGDRVEKEGVGPWWRQVIGERQFSSGHPAMQALNPVVYELFVEYGR